jgi:hypothetical protein
MSTRCSSPLSIKWFCLFFYLMFLFAQLQSSTSAFTPSSALGLGQLAHQRSASSPLHAAATPSPDLAASPPSAGAFGAFGANGTSGAFHGSRARSPAPLLLSPSAKQLSSATLSVPVSLRTASSPSLLWSSSVAPSAAPSSLASPFSPQGQAPKAPRRAPSPSASALFRTESSAAYVDALNAMGGSSGRLRTPSSLLPSASTPTLPTRVAPFSRPATPTRFGAAPTSPTTPTLTAPTAVGALPHVPVPAAWSRPHRLAHVLADLAALEARALASPASRLPDGGVLGMVQAQDAAHVRRLLATPTPGPSAPTLGSGVGPGVGPGSKNSDAVLRHTDRVGVSSTSGSGKNQSQRGSRSPPPLRPMSGTGDQAEAAPVMVRSEKCQDMNCEGGDYVLFVFPPTLFLSFFFSCFLNLFFPHCFRPSLYQVDVCRFCEAVMSDPRSEAGPHSSSCPRYDPHYPAV